jgi:hypothetical protein
MSEGGKSKKMLTRAGFLLVAGATFCDGFSVAHLNAPAYRKTWNIATSVNQVQPQGFFALHQTTTAAKHGFSYGLRMAAGNDDRWIVCG